MVSLEIELYGPPRMALSFAEMAKSYPERQKLFHIIAKHHFADSLNYEQSFRLFLKHLTAMELLEYVPNHVILKSLQGCLSEEIDHLQRASLEGE